MSVSQKFSRLFHAADPGYRWPLCCLLVLQLLFRCVRRVAGTKLACQWFREKRVTISLEGTRFVVGGIPGDLGYIIECFLNKSYETHPGFMPAEGDVCVDIGTNIGACYLNWARQNKSGQLYGFEPHPETYARLQENLSQNRLSADHVYAYAVGDQEGEVAIYTDPESNMAAVGADERSIRHDVKAVTLDSFCREAGINQIDLCKIDVEGHETAVLAGASEALNKTQRLILEYHSPELRQKVLAILQPDFEICYAEHTPVGLIFARKAPDGGVKGTSNDRS